jgi:hypothetical protein
MASLLPKNNAFGMNTPSWNLPFPVGNLTAAEILAYLPHSLKSVDIVDRFVTNGGKARTIAATVNEFRDLPGGVFRPNSALIMMSYSMRRAGYKNWTVGTHSDFERPKPELSEYDLDVGMFRTPRITHPKSAPLGQSVQKLRYNEESSPVEFKMLAAHTKTHPTGSDALDLTRCVLYAIAHPGEEWYFPTDYQSLVKKLGGPSQITLSHLDRAIFNRRNSYVFDLSKSIQPRPKNNSRRLRSKIENTSIMPQSRRFTAQEETPARAAVRQRARLGSNVLHAGDRRKSGRLANKANIDFREDGSDISVSIAQPFY